MKRTIVLPRDVTVDVTLTDDKHLDLLGPVTLTIKTGMAVISAYVDPDDARNLADALREAANGVDGFDDDYRASLREGRVG